MAGMKVLGAVLGCLDQQDFGPTIGFDNIVNARIVLEKANEMQNQTTEARALADRLLCVFVF